MTQFYSTIDDGLTGIDKDIFECEMVINELETILNTRYELPTHGYEETIWDKATIYRNECKRIVAEKNVELQQLIKQKHECIK